MKSQTHASSTVADGIRQGIPLGIATTLLGVSFGVVARPVMGVVPPLIMSLVVFAGGSQFAATAVLAAGGSPIAAVVAGTLLNLRYLLMGIAMAAATRGTMLRRTLIGQAIVDASWVLARRADGGFDVPVLLGSMVLQYLGWNLGTAVGVLASGLIGDPNRFGFDVIFPAFFLGLVMADLRARQRRRVAAAGMVVALALVPFTPPGIPVLAACLAVVVGGRR